MVNGMNTREYSRIMSTHTRLSDNTREYLSLVVAYSLSASVHSANSTSTRHSRVTLVPLSGENRLASLEIWMCEVWMCSLVGSRSRPRLARLGKGRAACCTGGTPASESAPRSCSF